MIFTLSRAHPHLKNNDQQKLDNSKSKKISLKNNLDSDNLKLNLTLAERSLLSPYIQFSSTKPADPPTIFQEEDRRRRSTEHLSISVCESLRAWSQPETAMDYHGNEVTVMSMIDQNGSRQHQYIYETFCVNEDESCTGIDTTAYTSKCQTKQIWVNALVKNSLNQIGWTKIKVRGACNCFLWSKSVEPESIWESLLRRR